VASYLKQDMITLTEMIESLQKIKIDVLIDLRSDNFTDMQKSEMCKKLQLLLSALANLEALQS